MVQMFRSAFLWGGDPGWLVCPWTEIQEVQTAIARSHVFEEADLRFMLSLFFYPAEVEDIPDLAK
jgi:hypothetical protein